jgi:hypothetical protein
MRRFQGPGYTFLLAGFLKIMTIGGLAASAPHEATRTAFGKVSAWLLVPVGLGMAWLAKQVGGAGGGRRSQGGSCDRTRRRQEPSARPLRQPAPLLA